MNESKQKEAVISSHFRKQMLSEKLLPSPCVDVCLL